MREKLITTIKHIGTELGIIVGACLAGYLLLVLVYAIPTDRIATNYENSLWLFDENMYPCIMGLGNTVLDNVSDEIMLATAAHENTRSPWLEAIYNTYELTGTIGSYEGEPVDYFRYWHGYLVFLKPLLFLFFYGNVRSVVMFTQIGLFTLLVYRFSKEAPKLVLPLFLTWILMNPVASIMCIHYNSVITLAMIGMLLVLRFKDKWDAESFNWSILFLGIGIATSYFDLLTVPAITFGLPIVLWYTLKTTYNAKKDIVNFLRLGISWAMGYGLFWAGKWVLGELITGSGIINDAVNQVLFRAGGVESISGMFVNIFTNAFQYTWVLAVVVLVGYFLVKKGFRGNGYMLVVYLVLALIPFVWYMVIKEHSNRHAFFTFRELSISMFAFASFVMTAGERKE